MFTGIVQALGRIESSEPNDDGRDLWLASEALDMTDVQVGDSIAVSGVCLTATEVRERRFRTYASFETLNCTMLGHLAAGSIVNLETALRADGRLGGHFVSGHVDGVGTIRQVRPSGESTELRAHLPASLGRYVAVKGSICIDGVSLTVNEVDGDEFSVNIIPHTQQVTTLGACRGGQRVNIEVDLIARYLERLMSYSPPRDEQPPRRAITQDLLKKCGFTEAS
jgi:riboflavin synthase